MARIQYVSMLFMVSNFEGCLFKGKISLCNPGCSQTCSVDRGGLKWMQRSACPCLLSAKIKDLHHHCAGQILSFYGFCLRVFAFVHAYMCACIHMHAAYVYMLGKCVSMNMCAYTPVCQFISHIVSFCCLFILFYPCLSCLPDCFLKRERKKVWD